MEIFSDYIKKQVVLSNFRYHWRTSMIQLTHFIFADDVLLFSKGDLHSTRILLEGVYQFSNCSGLQPNCNKSNCFFANVPEDVIREILASSGFQQGTLPVKYLGLP